MHKLIHVALGLVLFMTSCIRENSTGCPTEINVELSFQYNADTKKNVIGRYITTADLLIYDSAGNFYKRLIVNSMELRSKKNIYLIPGDYTFVLWGNYGLDSFIENKDALSKAEITTPAYSRKEIPSTNDRLYFGRKNIEVLPGEAPLSEWSQSDEVTFKNNHIGFKVLVRGLEPDNEELVITNLVPYNDFMMTYSGTKLIDYKPIQTQNTIVSPPTGQLYEFNTFRFLDDNEIEIQLINPSTKANVINPISLKEILEQQNISVDNTEELILFIEIVVDQTSVKVMVRPWDEIATVPSN